MSLVLMLFYWVGVPLLGLLLARGLLHRARAPLYRGLVVALSAVGFLGWLWLLAGEKLWLDHQVREMCAKDGGIRVYETVKLPPEKFNKYRQINFYRPIDGENALGPEYIFKEDRHYFRRGNPEVWRIHYRIFRRLDGKLLSEAVIYIRRGGDLPGPWHDSFFTCPEPKDIAVVEKTFIPSGLKKFQLRSEK